MEKRILIGVNDSIYSRRAVEYAVRMGSSVKSLSYTLFNVQPKVSDFLLEDAKTDPKARSALKDVINKNQENSKELVEKYKSQMIKLGAEEKRIETVTQAKIMGTAKDILHYGEQCLCDAIVLGRRGVTSLEEAFIGSVTNSVLEHSSVIPIWAIGREVTSSKIMVAIDGSESALNAVDHISFMVGDNPDTKVTLLHVTPRLRDYCTIEFGEEGEPVQEIITQGDKRCVDGFYVHAWQKFEEVGIAEDQIDIKEVKTTINVGKTIVDEAEKGNYGTVVIGRRGVNKSFFLGSVSRYVLAKASNCAVWLVP